jgi:ankyrin repeat protein
VEIALQTLPPGLDETYERILLQIPRMQWPKALTALEFLAFAKIPLTIHEVSDAVVVVPGCKKFEPEDRLFFDIVKIFPSLVSETATSEITLAHASVKDYLTSDRILQGPAAFFAVKQETADLRIAEICLTQLLSLDEPDPWLTDMGSGPYPDCWSTCWQDQLANRENLLYYSAHYWLGHCQMICPERPSMLRSLCLNLLGDGNKPVFTNWHTIVEEQIAWVDSKGVETSSPPSPLRYMAELGQKNIVHMLLRNGVDPDHGGRPSESPLRVAVYSGKIDIVNLLLSYGANPNGNDETEGGLLSCSGVNPDANHETAGGPLFAAAGRGDTATMRILAEAGADLNVRGRIAGSALQVAAARNVSPEALQWLLEAGVDVNAQGGRYNTALQALVARTSDFGVQLSLAPRMSRLRWNDDFGNTNAGDWVDGGHSETAIQNIHDDKEEEWSARLLVNLRLLLSWGADVNLSGGTYGTALQAAAAFQNVEAVQLLLQHGAKAEIVCGRYGTALQAAAISGSTPILKLLLEAGANVNAVGGKYGSALQAAAARPKSELNIQILLDAGADINFRGGVCGSALHATTVKLSVENMKPLIDAGADIDAVAGIHGTPLQAATAYGFIESLEVLLTAGADPTIQAGQHGTALITAKYYKRSQEIVRLLQKSEARWKHNTLTSAYKEEVNGAVPMAVQDGHPEHRNDSYSVLEPGPAETSPAFTATGGFLKAEA